MTEKSETPPQLQLFKTGDEISIMRGKHRNATAIVLDYSTATAEYAVKFPDGSLGVINAVNVRVPDEATITAGQFAQAFSDFGGEIPRVVMEALETLAPGITARIARIDA
jgi:hypothetical protein